MINTPNPTPRFAPITVLWVIGLLSAAAIVLLSWVSLANPFPTDTLDWNYLASSSLNLAAATGAAIAGTFVTRQFERNENPHRVWLSFTVGLWCWVLGQAIVFALDVTASPYPEGLSVIDLLWLLGYVALGLALYHQIVLLFSPGNDRRLPLFLVLVTGALGATALLTQLAIGAGLGQASHWTVVFMTMIYPVFDLLEGSAAIWLSLAFGRGQWSRPWWGMILFALADGSDTFFWVGGYDLIPVSAQNALNFLSTIFSFGGYLVIGFTLLMNYFILRYGHASGLLKSARLPEAPPPRTLS
mgnify:CR=1 FL=1